MFEALPNDPMLLLSVVNTKLRDYYSDVEALCQDLHIDKDTLIKKLGDIDYEYDPESNQFV